MDMMKISERRELRRKKHTALHEAGHAVIARLHGAKIEEVDMEGNEELFAFVKRESLSMKALKEFNPESHVAGEKMELPSGEGREEVARGAEVDAIIALAGPAVDLLGKWEIDQWDVQQAASFVSLTDGRNGVMTLDGQTRFNRLN